MLRRYERRAHDVREHITIPDRGDGGVEALQLRQAATEHDRLGIEQIDHRGEPAREAMLIAAKSRLGRGRGPRQPRSPAARAALRFPLRDLAQPGPGQPRLDAARETAVAGRPRELVRIGPRQRVVSPFAGDRVRPGEHLAVNRRRRRRRCRGSPRTRSRRLPRRRRSPRRGPRQSASLASAIGRSRMAARSRSSGLPLSQVEFEFLSSPVAGEMAPGVPNPMVPRASSASTSATRSRIAASVAS